MEARLGAALGTKPELKVERALAPASDDTAEAVAAVYDRRPESASAENGGHRPPLQEGESESTNVWNDESAESAFRAEARERGEPVVASRAAVEVTEATDTKSLPALDDLVKRLPPEVREVLDDLFRAKFTTVRRVPEKALKV